MKILGIEIGGVAKSVMKLGALLFMVLYIISPIDLLPEAILGPIGLIDDLVVILGGASILGFDVLRSARSRSPIRK